MQRVLLAVEAYAPDDMGESEISQDVYLTLRAAFDSYHTLVEAGHVKTMMIASDLSRKAVSWSRRERAAEEARMIVTTTAGERRRVGTKMFMAAWYAARYPGCAKLAAARFCAPYAWSTQPGIRFGYESVNRAIAAGLVSAELAHGRYSLTVTEAGTQLLAQAGS